MKEFMREWELDRQKQYKKMKIIDDKIEVVKKQLEVSINKIFKKTIEKVLKDFVSKTRQEFYDNDIKAQLPYHDNYDRDDE